jgi:methylmalonyl-CoA/ethylmalonyl-CoA epimerase
MALVWRLHHVGVAVADLDKAIETHQRLFGQTIAWGPIEDPMQKVTACFMRGTDGCLFELLAPLGDSSPLVGWLAKQIGAYHVCYEVDDIDAALHHARTNRCVVISEPTPAVAFDGRRVAWFFTPTRQLTELLERGA